MQGNFRKSWSPEEDQLLRYAIEKEEPHNPKPSKWSAISRHVPNRSNRDCRKRWAYHLAFSFVKGSWSTEEDALLTRGFERYGPKWSLVSTVVISRNNDQCAKRWREILDPSINRGNWLPEEDEQLINGVNKYGSSWSKIARLFTGRTSLATKNRYYALKRQGRVGEIEYPEHRTPPTAGRSNSVETGSEESSGQLSVSPCPSVVGSDTSLNWTDDADLHYLMQWLEASSAVEVAESGPWTFSMNSFSYDDPKDIHSNSFYS
ncbi:hypothetical protein BT96DRAFT_874658 [Gymnopus androsaceus JB14]|uniref:Homeodomain-like protein n=1 Tax=Gymnopus androsaceus JB14 TaxID=1447944 RepID=A0A6A4I9N6_9AGAR|nr:hypothetical protein BT96DRAFT_874658 [Gymnopus androsaceus JB14]